MLKQDRYTVHTNKRIWFRYPLTQPCTGYADNMLKLLFVSEIWIAYNNEKKVHSYIEWCSH